MGFNSACKGLSTTTWRHTARKYRHTPSSRDVSTRWHLSVSSLSNGLIHGERITVPLDRSICGLQDRCWHRLEGKNPSAPGIEPRLSSLQPKAIYWRSWTCSRIPVPWRNTAMQRNVSPPQWSTHRLTRMQLKPLIHVTYLEIFTTALTTAHLTVRKLDKRN
jgi:hypothetical protein